VSENVALAVVFALLAAFLYALSNVLEQSVAETMPDEHALRVSLITRLARQPRWVIGFVSDAGGFAASAAALAFGAVVFVEPIVSLGLLISMLLGALIGHRNIRPHDWMAAAVLCAGLSLFLYETSPTGGRNIVPPLRWTVAAPCIAVVVLACVVAARGSSRGPRSALLGIGGAIAFAASVILTKAFVHYLGDGPFAWAPHWEPYAMAVAILVGFLLVQSAFQAGSLAAAVAGIEATEPVVAVILGIVLLDEHVAARGRFGVLVLVVAALAVVGALVSLAHVEDGRVVDATAGSDSGEPATPRPATPDRGG
jgi:drug/metabolite transporter (DMT)-like permease